MSRYIEKILKRENTGKISVNIQEKRLGQGEGHQLYGMLLRVQIR